MERNCHHPITLVKRKLDAIAVVNVYIDIEHSGIISDDVQINKLEGSSAVYHVSRPEQF